MAEPGTGAAFTVRLVAPDGSPAGLGALVDGRHVVTCAHVVNAALGQPTLSQPQPDGLVRLQFPLLDGSAAGPAASTAVGAVIEARVVVWLPPATRTAAGDDIAGLELTPGSVLPDGAVPARLAVEQPRLGDEVYVFGYPPSRPDGGRVATTVMGPVQNGRVQLDSLPDSALRVQPGFSGSPVFDAATGRVIGLLVLAAQASARDSYAISADRLRIAWPQVLAGRWQPGGAVRPAKPGELTILQVGDLRLDSARLSTAALADHAFGGPLRADLRQLAAERDVRPDLIVVTGNLSERGLAAELRQAADFIGAIADEADVPRRHVAIVPGARDVSTQLCQAYFLEQEAEGAAPVPPFARKWRPFTKTFTDFYAGSGLIAFAPDEPWTLFEMHDLGVVVAGLNSTMAVSHLPEDQYGSVGIQQLQWFRGRLARYRAEGWLRLAVTQHGVTAAGASDTGYLRDTGDLDQVLGRLQLAHLLLHGGADPGSSGGSDSGSPLPEPQRLPSGLMAFGIGQEDLGTGAAAGSYQIITVRGDGFHRTARRYQPGEHSWAAAEPGSNAPRTRDWVRYPLSNTGLAFPAPTGGTGGSSLDSLVPVGLADADAMPATIGRDGVPGDLAIADRDEGPAWDGPPSKSDASHAGWDIYVAGRDIAGLGIPGGGPSGSGRATDSFLGRVAEATRVRFPEAVVTEHSRGGSAYLRVSRPLGGGLVEVRPIGVIDGPAIGASLDAFVNQVHAQFTANDPQVRSELVHSGLAAPPELTARARPGRCPVAQLRRLPGAA